MALLPGVHYYVGIGIKIVFLIIELPREQVADSGVNMELAMSAPFVYTVAVSLCSHDRCERVGPADEDSRGWQNLVHVIIGRGVRGRSTTGENLWNQPSWARDNAGEINTIAFGTALG
jgi:hypothetical protein